MLPVCGISRPKLCRSWMRRSKSCRVNGWKCYEMLMVGFEPSQRKCEGFKTVPANYLSHLFNQCLVSNGNLRTKCRHHESPMPVIFPRSHYDSTGNHRGSGSKPFKAFMNPNENTNLRRCTAYQCNQSSLKCKLKFQLLDPTPKNCCLGSKNHPALRIPSHDIRTSRNRFTAFWTLAQHCDSVSGASAGCSPRHVIQDRRS